MEKIYVGKSVCNFIDKILATEPKSAEEGFFDETLTYSTKFPNGYEMDIKLCGVTEFEEGGCNTPWCEAVLFNERGAEVCCTEPFDDFFGVWSFLYSGSEYSVEVIPDRGQKDLTWDEVFEFANGSACGSAELKRKDNARYEIGNWARTNGFGEIEEAESAEEAIDKLCEKFEFIFNDNGDLIKVSEKKSVLPLSL